MRSHARLLHPALVCMAALVADCGTRAPAGLPRFDFTDSGGCGDVFVFKTNADRSEFATVHADAKQLGIEKGQERTFAIVRTPAGLDVRVDVYAQAPISPEYCSDFVSEEKPIARWTAVAGRVSITLRDGGGGPVGTYEAIVVLEDAVFEDGTARRVEQRDPIEITAVVGWLAG